MDGNHTLSEFNVNQLRFEVKGKIHDKVYFRFRNRYTREPVPGNLDNISRSVDLAFLRIDLSKRTNFLLENYVPIGEVLNLILIQLIS